MINRFKVLHTLGVGFLSYCSPELQPTVCVCPYCALMHVRRGGEGRFLLSCCPTFPVSKWSRAGRQGVRKPLWY